MSGIPVIIPARYSSSRFPGKPLALIKGKPMVIWVCEQAAKAVGKGNVYVATDSRKVADVVKKSGFLVVMTSELCATGTDRVAEAMRVLNFVKAINVQGDEPMIDPNVILRVAGELEKSGKEVINVCTEIKNRDEVISPAIPKVAIASDGSLIYMSRAPIPMAKSGKIVLGNQAQKQVCVYGLSIDLLGSFGPGQEKSSIEKIEDIEILRFLENRVTVRMINIETNSIAVDFPEDILKVEKALDGL